MRISNLGGGGGRDVPQKRGGTEAATALATSASELAALRLPAVRSQHKRKLKGLLPAAALFRCFWSATSGSGLAN
ncbi:hypothetical protein MRX96_052360 [Rhipicephalus microplus]